LANRNQGQDRKQASEMFSNLLKSKDFKSSAEESLAWMDGLNKDNQIV